jgi:polar amino acid transport system permease protein
LSSPPATRPAAEPAGDERLRELAARKVAPLRRPGRWVAAAVVLVLLAQLAHALVTNPVFQWNVFGYWFFRPVILDGLLLTLELTGLSAVFGLVCGSCSHSCGCRRTRCCRPFTGPMSGSSVPSR